MVASARFLAPPNDRGARLGSAVADCQPSPDCRRSPAAGHAARHDLPGTRPGVASLASVTFDGVAKVFPDGTRAVDGLEPRGTRRRVHGLRRTVRMWEDDGAPDGRGPRGRDRGNHPHRRHGRQRRAAAGAGHRDGVPELRALSAHVRGRQHRLRSEDAEGPEASDRGARRGDRRCAPPDGAHGATAESAVRRSAPAGRDGPRDHPESTASC